MTPKAKREGFAGIHIDVSRRVASRAMRGTGLEAGKGANWGTWDGELGNGVTWNWGAGELKL